MKDMKHAMVAVPLALLTIALCLSIAQSRNDIRLADVPAVPSLATYSIRSVSKDGQLSRIMQVTSFFEPKVHCHADGSQSVGVLGVWQVAPRVPPGSAYEIVKD